MLPQIRYTQFPSIIHKQRCALDARLRAVSNVHVIHKVRLWAEWALHTRASLSQKLNEGVNACHWFAGDKHLKQGNSCSGQIIALLHRRLRTYKGDHCRCIIIYAYLIQFLRQTQEVLFKRMSSIDEAITRGPKSRVACNLFAFL